MTTTTAAEHQPDTPPAARPLAACLGHTNTGQRMSGRRRSGESEHSPRRVRARLRAEVAVKLRADGLTYDQIATHAGPDGAPLYSSRKRAHEAVRAQLGRGAILAAHQLLAPLDGTHASQKRAGIPELQARMAALLGAIERGEIPATNEQHAAIASAYLVLAP
jgi:hypothetical protein